MKKNCWNLPPVSLNIMTAGKAIFDVLSFRVTPAITAAKRIKQIKNRTLFLEDFFCF